MNKSMTPPTASEVVSAAAPKMPFPHHVKAEDPHLRVSEAHKATALVDSGEWQVKIYNGLGYVYAIAFGSTKKSAEERAAKICARVDCQESADLTLLRTSHGKLVEALKLLEPIHTAANRVLELYSAQYMRGNDDGGRVAHAMGQLQSAVGTASKSYPREVVRQATAASGEGSHKP